MSTRAELERVSFAQRIRNGWLAGFGIALGALALYVWFWMSGAGWWNARLDTTPPPEFTPGLSYANYRASSVPWSAHVVRMDRTRRDLEIQDTHAYRAAYGISTLSQQIKAFPSGLGEPLVAVNGDFYLRKGAYTGDPRAQRRRVLLDRLKWKLSYRQCYIAFQAHLGGW
jgi:hypothetical protein